MSMASEVQRRVTELLKAGEREKAAMLRVLLSELQGAAKEARRELTEAEEVQVLRRERKKRQESMVAFRQAGREELASNEEWVISVIDALLPQQLDEQALVALIDQIIAEVGASTPKDMGKVMSTLMARVSGQVDGALASRLVKERLLA